MADISTTLTAALNRALDSIIEDVAKEGLKALRRVLEGSGFSKSEHLRDYEVFAHVRGRSITFEILLDVEAVIPEDEAAKKALAAQEESLKEVEESATATFGLSTAGPRRVVGLTDARRDARRSPRDARRPARDARRTARDRLVAKEVANVRPRSARVTRAGRLAVALRRSVRETESEVVMPKGQFQGIIAGFLNELRSVLRDQFAPKLSEIVRSYGA